MGRPKLEWSVLLQFAASQHGKLLSPSDTYVNNHSLLLWECALGHQFRKSYNNAKDKGEWCPECGKNQSAEDRVRFALTHLLGTPFVKTRAVLGEGLELDGYSEKLHLAFEFQGPQHYAFHSHFHGTADAFFAQQARDARKLALARAKDIRLLVIPWQAALNDARLVQTLLDALAAAHITPVQAAASIPWQDFRKHHPFAQEMERYAQARGGHFVGPYENMHEKTAWVCAEGHVFQMPPTSVKWLRHWCPECSTKRKLARETVEARIWALDPAATLVTPGAVGSGDKVQIRCSQGHLFTRTPDDLKRGRFCPACRQGHRLPRRLPAVVCSVR